MKVSQRNQSSSENLTHTSSSSMIITFDLLAIRIVMQSTSLEKSVGILETFILKLKIPTALSYALNALKILESVFKKPPNMSKFFPIDSFGFNSESGFRTTNELSLILSFMDFL